MSTWTADNIVATKRERAIPGSGGNKAVDVSFTSEIFKDGVKHHDYNEPNVGFHPSETVEQNITRIINQHLSVWMKTEEFGTTLNIPTITKTPPEAPAEKAKEVVDAEVAAKDEAIQFDTAWQTFQKQEMLLAKGVVVDNSALVAAKETLSTMLSANPELEKRIQVRPF